MSNSSFGFVIRPFRGLKGRLLFAELSPDGKVIGTGFTEIEAADGSPLLNLEKDQVVLVSYQLDKDQVKYAVVNSWFVTSSFIVATTHWMRFMRKWSAGQEPCEGQAQEIEQSHP